MTSSGICGFPNCKNVTSKYSSFFKKWECDEHSFDKVVWPNVDKTQTLKGTKLIKVDGQVVATSIDQREFVELPTKTGSPFGRNFFNKNKKT